ncbi:MAG: ABC transporter substrate-binding protein [Halanaerobiales bacterium]
MKKSLLFTGVFMLILIFTLTGSIFAADHPAEVQEWAEQVKDEHGGTTITVSMGTHPSTEAMREMVDEFTEMTGIEVEWDIISEPKLRPLHMTKASAGISSFDVWMVDGFFINEYVSKDTLMPIEELQEKRETPDWFDYEDIIPAYREAIASVDGEPYAVPTAGESRFIAYRKDLFEEHDLDLPQTTEELMEVAEYFEEEVPDIHGLVTRAQSGIFHASGWLHVLYQFSEGWIDQETGEVLADSPEVIESLKYWNDLIRTGPSDAASYTHEECSSAFMSGDAALWFDATAIAGRLIDPEKSEVHDQVGFLPPPEGPKGRYGGLAGWSLGVPKMTEKKDAAWAFIVWMTSEYNAPEYMENGGVLVRDSLFENPEITSEHPEMYEALAETFDAAKNLTDKGYVWIPPTWMANSVLDMAGKYGNQALIGDITEEEACESLADELNDIQSKF